jgi:hypothetical protein
MGRGQKRHLRFRRGGMAKAFYAVKWWLARTWCRFILVVGWLERVLELCRSLHRGIRRDDSRVVKGCELEMALGNHDVASVKFLDGM